MKIRQNGAIKMWNGLPVVCAYPRFRCQTTPSELTVPASATCWVDVDPEMQNPAPIVFYVLISKIDEIENH